VLAASPAVAVGALALVGLMARQSPAASTANAAGGVAALSRAGLTARQAKEQQEEVKEEEEAPTSPPSSPWLRRGEKLDDPGERGLVPGDLRDAGFAKDVPIRRKSNFAKTMHEYLREPWEDPNKLVKGSSPMFAKPPPLPPPPPFDLTRVAGALPPLGLWDPLNLCPINDYGTYFKYRSAEIKHGRVAMLGILGLFFQHFEDLRLPGLEDVPSGIWAPTTPESGFLSVLVLGYIFLLETQWLLQDPRTFPGDLGDPLQLQIWIPASDYDLEGNIDWRNYEINNGRLAMIGIVGTLVAELATGKDAFEQLGLRDPGELKSGLDLMP